MEVVVIVEAAELLVSGVPITAVTLGVTEEIAVVLGLAIEFFFMHGKVESGWDWAIAAHTGCLEVIIVIPSAPLFVADVPVATISP